MELTDFQWQERDGRFEDDAPFHEWIYVHGSGRILGAIQGPTDKRGGFAHNVVFMFMQQVTMTGGPFLFLDFDSAKRYIEAKVSEYFQSVSPEGSVTLTPAEVKPDPMQQMLEALKTMLLGLSKSGPEIMKTKNAALLNEH